MRVVDHSTSTARLEMIKMALGIGAGTGAALTLVLARRRQWATEHDAAERRLTELYVKAVEQLGSEQAAVRHGALYALERVAQDNPNHRQTVVDVICAYLRAPYTLRPNKTDALRLGVRRPLVKSAYRRTTSSALAHNTDTPKHHTAEESRRLQEREVRLTAQRILTRHLRPRDDNRKRLHTYWPGMDLDLNSATLIDFDLDICRIHTAIFTNAQFDGSAPFEGAQFTGNVSFVGAQLAGEAWFDGAQFTGDVSFDGARFADGAWFKGARFAGEAWFKGARFADRACFRDAQFTSNSSFNGVQFTGDASFTGAQFAGGALFKDAQFTGDVSFEGAQFTGGASARFIDGASFEGARFAGGAWFKGVQFTCHPWFKDAQFANGFPAPLKQPLPTLDA